MSDILARLRERPMNRFQVTVVAVCLILNMLDGFDVLAMAFAAPALREAWHLESERLGLLLSAGLFGMTLGSLFIAPLSDRLGRKPVIVACVADMALGMLLSATARNVPELLALRVITGLGLGGLLASMNALVSEYMPERKRDFGVSMMVLGYALGAAIGGLGAVPLVQAFGWPPVFLIGGIGATLMLPLAILLLPESIDFLLIRRGKTALARLNKILKHLAEPAVAELPPAPITQEASGSYFDLLGPDLRRGALLICASFFAVFLTNVFLVSWTPTLLRDFGLSPSNAIYGSLIMHCGAVTGGFAMGALAAQFGLRLLSPVFILSLFVTVMLFALLSGPLWLLLSITLAIGFFGNGASTSLYAIAPRVFPARLRASGSGLAIGCGRIGGIVSPYAAGWMMDQGWERPLYSLVICAPLIVAAALVPMIREIGGGARRAAGGLAVSSRSS